MYRYIKDTSGTSLAVQWLRLYASNAGGMGSISGWGIKILHATQCGQKVKIFKKNWLVGGIQWNRKFLSFFLKDFF